MGRMNRPGHESPVLSGVLSAATQAPPSARSIHSGWLIIFRQKLLFWWKVQRGMGWGSERSAVLALS